MLVAGLELCTGTRNIGQHAGQGKTTDLILLVASSPFQTLPVHYLSESLGRKILMRSYSVLFYYLFIKNIAFVHFSL